MERIAALSDEALMARLSAGDEPAFREIYERYDSLLYSFAYRKLLNTQEAQDVVQEVFIALWNNRVGFRLQTTLAAYLHKSVLNKVFNIFKHRTTMDKYLIKSQVFIETDTNQTDYLIREKDIAALIEKEIAAMPPKMREIYELKRKHYLSAREIAEQLDISEHTVNTQVKRALKLLRLKLGVLIYMLYILH